MNSTTKQTGKASLPASRDSKVGRVAPRAPLPAPAPVPPSKPALRQFACYWSNGEMLLVEGESLHRVARTIERGALDGRFLLAVIDAAAAVKPEPNGLPFRVMVAATRKG